MRKAGAKGQQWRSVSHGKRRRAREWMVRTEEQEGMERMLRELGTVEGERRAGTIYYRLRRGPAMEPARAIRDGLGHADCRTA
jgi:hypothetical protein